HVNLSPVLVELDIVHQLIDQVDATAVIGIDVLAAAGIGNLGGIETGAGIAHHDQHAPLLVTGHVAFDHFGGIAFRSVHDRIGQGFGQGEFDVVFVSLSAFHFPHHIHHAADDRVD